MAVEKLLPQNVEAEGSMLGSLLIDPDAFFEVIDLCQHAMCYRESHRIIMHAIEDLNEAGTPADLITLTDELARRGKLEEVGGASYVSALANQVPTSRNAKLYAAIVRRCYINRRLIHYAGQIAGLAYNEPEGEETLAQSIQMLLDFSAELETGDVVSLGTILSGVIDNIDAMKAGGASATGVQTGLRAWDNLLGTMRKGGLYTLAARPAIGKTSLALSLAYETWTRHSHRSLIFSLEMDRNELGQRFLSLASGVDGQRIRLAYLNDDEMNRVADTAGTLADAAIYVDDTPAITLSALTAKAHRVIAQYHVDLIIIDYLQLMGSSGRQENRQQEVSAFARGLKNLARKLGVPVLALSQLSRAVEARAEKVPQLSDLRESGEIEQASDAVLFIYRDEVYNEDTDRRNIADIIVAKHRHGPIGSFSLFFEKATTRYRNLRMTTVGAVTGMESDTPEGDGE